MVHIIKNPNSIPNALAPQQQSMLKEVKAFAWKKVQHLYEVLSSWKLQQQNNVPPYGPNILVQYFSSCPLIFYFVSPPFLYKISIYSALA